MNARDVAFRDNVASDQGGGAWGDCEASDGAVLECLRCDFERNVAVDGGGLGDVARRRGSSPKLCVLNTALVTSRAGVAPERLRADPEVWGRLVESCVGAHLLNTGPADGLEVSRPAPRARRLPRSLSACARARGGCGFGRDPVGRLPGAAGGGVDRVNRGYRKPRT